MIRTVLLAIGVLTLAGLMAPAAMAERPTSPKLDQTATATPEVTPNATNASSDANVSVGERLSGILGVQEAELNGTVQTRTFGIKIAQAASADAKAEVVSEQLREIENRLTELEAQREELKQARKNGSIRQSEYRVRVTELAAEIQNVEQLANASDQRAKKLPRETLEANGVNVSAIQTLKQRAEMLTGPEVAAIAQSIAGKRVDKPVQAGGPGDPEPPEGVPGDGEDAGPPVDRPDDADADTDQRGNETRPTDRDDRGAEETDSRDAGNRDGSETPDNADDSRLGENRSDHDGRSEDGESRGGSDGDGSSGGSGGDRGGNHGR